MKKLFTILAILLFISCDSEHDQWRDAAGKVQSVRQVKIDNKYDTCYAEVWIADFGWGDRNVCNVYEVPCPCSVHAGDSMKIIFTTQQALPEKKVSNPYND